MINFLTYYLSFFSSGEGHTDPYSLTQALAIGARKWGAEIYLSSPVQALSQKEDGTWDVQTPHGMINAKHVVNASGKEMFVFLDVFFYFELYDQYVCMSMINFLIWINHCRI